MKTLKRFCATTLLLALFATPGLAGESSMPGAPAPPPNEPPPTENTTSALSIADGADTSAIDTALEMLGSLLDLL